MALVQHLLDGIEQRCARRAQSVLQCPVGGEQMTIQRTMPWNAGRLTTLAAIAALWAVALAEADATPPKTDGPFNVLEWRNGVSTSRSGYTVWVWVASSRHQARVPGHKGQIGSPDQRAMLGVKCRAPGGALPEQYPAHTAQGEIRLDDHPDQPGTYTMIHPMYWFLELSKQASETWPVQVRVNAGAPIRGTLEHPLTNYAGIHPGLDIYLSGEEIVEAMVDAEAITIEVENKEMSLTARFEPGEDARRAARLMRTACPTANRG